MGHRIFSARAAGIAMGLALAITAASIQAQQGRTVTASLADPLVLYQDPDSRTAIGKIGKSQFAPTPLIETRGEYGRIDVGGAQYWIDLSKVRVSSGVAASCTAGLSQKRVTVSTAASRGSNGECGR
jgi:hypothetical protein